MPSQPAKTWTPERQARLAQGYRQYKEENPCILDQLTSIFRSTPDLSLIVIYTCLLVITILSSLLLSDMYAGAVAVYSSISLGMYVMIVYTMLSIIDPSTPYYPPANSQLFLSNNAPGLQTISEHSTWGTDAHPIAPTEPLLNGSEARDNTQQPSHFAPNTTTIFSPTSLTQVVSTNQRSTLTNNKSTTSPRQIDDHQQLASLLLPATDTVAFSTQHYAGISLPLNAPKFQPHLPLQQNPQTSQPSQPYPPPNPFPTITLPLTSVPGGGIPSFNSLKNETKIMKNQHNSIYPQPYIAQPQLDQSPIHHYPRQPLQPLSPQPTTISQPHVSTTPFHAVLAAAPIIKLNTFNTPQQHPVLSYTLPTTTISQPQKPTNHFQQLHLSSLLTPQQQDERPPTSESHFSTLGLSPYAPTPPSATSSPYNNFMTRTLPLNNSLFALYSTTQCRTCPKSNSIKHPRTYHCKYCHRCYYLRDHHCFLLNNCVTKKNIFLYIHFLSTLLFGSLFVAWLTIYYFFKYNPPYNAPPAHFQYNLIFFFILLGVSLGFIYIGVMLLYRIILTIKFNLTWYERQIVEKLLYDAKHVETNPNDSTTPMPTPNDATYLTHQGSCDDTNWHTAQLLSQISLEPNTTSQSSTPQTPSTIASSMMSMINIPQDQQYHYQQQLQHQRSLLGGLKAICDVDSEVLEVIPLYYYFLSPLLPMQFNIEIYVKTQYYSQERVNNNDNNSSMILKMKQSQYDSSQTGDNSIIHSHETVDLTTMVRTLIREKRYREINENKSSVWVYDLKLSSTILFVVLLHLITAPIYTMVHRTVVFAEELINNQDDLI